MNSFVLLFVEYKLNKIKLLPKTALLKMQNWCAYQERSQNEARQKLYGSGLTNEEIEEVITQLISENFINEERFAIALTGGKFRIKNWGRNKIKQELKKHRISEYVINKALQSIDEEEYLKVINKVLIKKTRLTKQKDSQKQTYLVCNYAISRGFEADLVKEEYKKIIDQK